MSFDDGGTGFRAVAAADDRFERLVRRRVFLLYWLLCVANRLAESADVLRDAAAAALRCGQPPNARASPSAVMTNEIADSLF